MTKIIEGLTRWHSTTFNSTFRHYNRPSHSQIPETQPKWRSASTIKLVHSIN